VTKEMPMDQQNEQFENYLREFEPKRLRALELPNDVRPLWPRRLAAAAGVLLAVGGVWWFAPKQKHDNAENVFNQTKSALANTGFPSQRFQLLPLTRIALRDPRRLDTELEEASRHLLPSFRKSDSALRVLAKERLSGE
jgi:hypothetical protein